MHFLGQKTICDTVLVKIRTGMLDVIMFILTRITLMYDKLYR